jgi:hypothetical protein
MVYTCALKDIASLIRILTGMTLNKKLICDGTIHLKKDGAACFC